MFATNIKIFIPTASTDFTEGNYVAHYVVNENYKNLWQIFRSCVDNNLILNTYQETLTIQDGCLIISQTYFSISSSKASAFRESGIQQNFIDLYSNKNFKTEVSTYEIDSFDTLGQMNGLVSVVEEPYRMMDMTFPVAQLG